MTHWNKFDDEVPGLPTAFERLEKVEGCRLVQGRAGLEAITGGIMPNKYTLRDLGIVHDTKDPNGNVVHSDFMPMVSQCDTCLHAPHAHSLFRFNPLSFLPSLSARSSRSPLQFIVEEEMDGCCTSDFCCRVCCSPNHPTILKMW